MSDRVDQDGAAYAGSQLQTQLYVNRRSGELNAAIDAQLPGLGDSQIEWRSPLARDRYAEYRDVAFLQHVDLVQHAAALREFWPSGGPRWDALAVTAAGGRPGVLLVEGKSYPKELYGRGCKAEPGSRSRAKIERSLAWTQDRLGVADRTPADWCGTLYQSANRLAHLCWLHSLGVHAWLVHLLFVEDPHDPTTADEWSAAIEQVNGELGLAGVQVEGAGHVLLAAGSREELVGGAPA